MTVKVILRDGEQDGHARWRISTIGQLAMDNNMASGQRRAMWKRTPKAAADKFQHGFNVHHPFVYETDIYPLR